LIVSKLAITQITSYPFGLLILTTIKKSHLIGLDMLLKYIEQTNLFFDQIYLSACLKMNINSENELFLGQKRHFLKCIAVLWLKKITHYDLKTAIF